jgi:hypothetical protein
LKAKLRIVRGFVEEGKEELRRLPKAAAVQVRKRKFALLPCSIVKQGVIA